MLYNNILRTVLLFLIFTHVLCLKTAAQVNLNQGLIAYYPFNSNANDASGNGHNGATAGGVSLTTDRFGNVGSAYHLDGINGFIEVTDNGQLTPDKVSFALWFRTESDDIQTLIGKENFSTAEGAVYQIAINWAQEPGVLFNLTGNDEIDCGYNVSGSYVSGGPMPFSKNDWHCLVATFDGVEQRLYVDGSLLGVKYPPFTGSRKCATPIRFGQWYQGLQAFKGDLDEIRMYDRALTEDEVNALCPAGTAGLSAGFEISIDCRNEITFTDTTTLVNPANPSWFWSFGDGAVSNLQHPVHSYAVSGKYEVKLEITNMGQKIRVTKDLNVLAGSSAPCAEAGFTAPDTVCVNTPIQLQNTSINGTNFFWNFCSGSLYNLPTVTDLGNPGGKMNTPTFLAMAKDGNDFYVFITNNTGGLLKLSFGNSLLNTPVVQDLGNMGGVIPDHTEGVQVVQDGSGWHVLLVGGTNTTTHALVKVDFGASLSNASPVAVSWGNVGNMDYPNDLYVVKAGNNWFGFTVNFLNNTITRFDFGASVANQPQGVNLGNIGTLAHPTGIFATQENGRWYVFVTNEQSGTISRLDFGTSPGNTPTGTNLGNGGGIIANPRDLTIIHDCGNIFGLVVGAGTSSLTRIDFESGITSGISATLLQSGGVFNFPHSVSPVFREGDELYAFIVNASGNNLCRLAFNSCSDASIPSSSQMQPPAFTYNKPGTYTINLLMDEGLPTQNTFCKTIIVQPEAVVDLGADQTVCEGVAVELDAGPGFSSYKWSNNTGTRKIAVTQTGTYQVAVSNGGCTAQDDIDITVNQVMQLTPVVTDVDCNHPGGSIAANITGGTLPLSYALNGAGPSSANVFDNLPVGDHTVEVQDNTGCKITATVTVEEDANNVIATSAAGTDPTCNGLQDGAIALQILKGIPPFEFAIKGQPYQATPSFTDLPEGSYLVYIRNAVCLDSQLVQLTSPEPIDIGLTKEDELCSRKNGSVQVNTTGGTPPYALYWDNVSAAGSSFDGLEQGVYDLKVIDNNGCEEYATVDISNIIPPRVTILNGDTTINIGETIQLQAINAPDYLWTPYDGLSCIDCATPVARPMQPVSYIVTTVTGNNCIASDTVNVKLSYNLTLHVPNAFTPNNDGRNDVFRAKAKGVATYRLKIYNRWGQLVFATNDQNRGWDGTFRSVFQPNGTYVYFIEYAYFGKEEQLLLQKGTFSLLR